MMHLSHADGTASRTSVYSVTGRPEKLSVMCCSAEELDSTNSSCLSPLLFPTTRKQDRASTCSVWRGWKNDLWVGQYVAGCQQVEGRESGMW